MPLPVESDSLTPRLPTTLPSPQLDPASQPTPTATRVIPATATRSPAAQQAGQVSLAEFWTTFEPVGNYKIDVYHLRYKTVAYNEQSIEIDANLYVPQVDEQTNFPILVYAPGTTGLSDRCAPLNEWSSGSNWGAYHSYMLEYTAQGFIGVLPNYQGLGDSDQAHPYFISEFQARALLDAARAAYNSLEASPQVAARPMEAVFMAGYSSGGHAVFAAKDFATSYAPELPLKGVIGHGPTTNIKTLFKENAVFSPYVVQAYRDFYGPEIVHPADVFQDRWVANFEADVMSRCVDQIFEYYSPSARQMYRPEFMEALQTNSLQARLPAFNTALEANSAGLSPDGIEILVLILQGTADQVVTPPSQRQFAIELCQLGNHVTYISYPAVSHPNIRRVSFSDTVNWIESVANGGLPELSCANLTSQ